MASSGCPVETSLQLISGRWKARILWILYTGTKRFGELRRSLPGITEKMLAQQLRELERDQLVIRKQYPEMPPRVEYSLSPFGLTLAPVLEELKRWVIAHQEKLVQLVGSETAERTQE